mmetsp:Transcript_9880/g.41480  ORF Transcript_9880/g.41480 Transcript_9880/m.41480 type:complete len:244 (+) Transcript_9880:1581-2312(+)
MRRNRRGTAGKVAGPNAAFGNTAALLAGEERKRRGRVARRSSGGVRSHRRRRFLLRGGNPLFVFVQWVFSEIRRSLPSELPLEAADGSEAARAGQGRHGRHRRQVLARPEPRVLRSEVRASCTRRRALGRVTGVVVPVFVIEPDAGVAVHGVAQKAGGGLRGVLHTMNVVRWRREVRFCRGIVRRRARRSLLGALLRGLFFFSAALLSFHRLGRGRRAHQTGGLAVGHAEDVAVPHELGGLEH